MNGTAAPAKLRDLLWFPLLLGSTLFALGCGGEGPDSAVPGQADDPAQLGAGADPGEAPPSSVTGTTSPASGGIPSVVSLEPVEPGAFPAPPQPPTEIVDQNGLAFIPRFTAVRVGQTVEFRNSEEVPHQVRVIDPASDSTLFEVMTLQGETYEYAFERAGGYALACDLHPGMIGFVLAVDGPYFATAEADGSFVIPDVPPGSYTARVWNTLLSKRLEQTVEVGERTRLTLVPGA